MAVMLLPFIDRKSQGFTEDPANIPGIAMYGPLTVKEILENTQG